MPRPETRRFDALLGATLMLSLLAPASAQDLTPQLPQGDGPLVVVELFTSQGCSSCPPADDLLGALAEAADAGAGILPLAYHVDYWDYLGWKDPFASSDWTDRQRAYGRAQQARSVYTPQIMVQGREGMVGSRRGSVLDSIRRQAAAASPVQVTARARREGDQLALDISAKVTGPTGADEVLVLVPVYQDGQRTDVRAGENHGRRLKDERVVRFLGRAFRLPGTQGAAGSRTVRAPLDPTWGRGRIGAAVLVQDPSSMKILGAAAVAVPEA